MSDIDALRERYIRSYGKHAAPSALLAEIEERLQVRLPRDFRRICEVFDGSGINAIPFLSLAGNAPRLNPISETQRLRNTINLPATLVVLSEPPESLIVMDCADGSVHWLGAMEAYALNESGIPPAADHWNSFARFFEFVLDEEERDRRGL